MITHRVFWIYLPATLVPKTYSLTGIYDGTVEIELNAPGWHMIGLPFNYSWRHLGVKDSSHQNVFSLREGVDQGLLLEYIWEWDPVRGRYYTYSTTTDDFTLRKGRSYWVRTQKGDLVIVAPYKVPPPLPTEKKLTILSHPSSITEGAPQPPPPPDINDDADNVGKEKAIAYPNPVSGQGKVTFELTSEEPTKIKVEVMDTAGHKVYESELIPNTRHVWNIPGGTANGLYLYQITGEGEYGKPVAGKVGKLLILN